MKNKIAYSAFALAIVIAIAFGVYYYRNNKAAPLKVSAPDGGLKQPGIKKLVDGIVTINAYTKEEKFHPDMKQATADTLAIKLAEIDKEKPKDGASLVEHDVWAKKRRPILVELINSFYRYSNGKANKMEDKEIQQIVIFESTFNGIYD